MNDKNQNDISEMKYSKLIKKRQVDNLVKPYLSATETDVFVLVFISFFITNLFPSLTIITMVLGTFYTTQIYFLKKITYKSFEQNQFNKLLTELRIGSLLSIVVLISCIFIPTLYSHIIKMISTLNLPNIDFSYTPKGGKMSYRKCLSFISVAIGIGLLYTVQTLKKLKKTYDNS